MSSASRSRSSRRRAGIRSWSYPDSALHEAVRRAAVLRLHVRRGRQLHHPGVAAVRSADPPPSALLDGRPDGAGDLRQLLHSPFMSATIAGISPPASRPLRPYRRALPARWTAIVHAAALAFVLIGFFIWLAENIARSSASGATRISSAPGPRSISASGAPGRCW